MPALIFIAILLLTLFQVVVLPLNFAFALLVAYSVFLKKTSVYIWLIVLAVLFALFANLSLGIVLFAFATTFFLLKVGSEFLPDNNLIKFFIVVASVPLSEMFLLLSLKVFS